MQQHCVSYGLWSRCVVQLRQHNICRRMLAGPGFCWRVVGVAGGGGVLDSGARFGVEGCACGSVNNLRSLQDACVECIAMQPSSKPGLASSRADQQGKMSHFLGNFGRCDSHHNP
jgi:hypothetical protein